MEWPGGGGLRLQPIRPPACQQGKAEVAIVSGDVEDAYGRDKPGHDDRRVNECLNSQAAQCTVGHTRGRVARLSNAPILVLTAEDAAAKSIAVTVWTAAAQGGRRRRHRPYRSGKNNNSEQRSRKLFHHHFSPILHEWRPANSTGHTEHRMNAARDRSVSSDQQAITGARQAVATENGAESNSGYSCS